MSEGQQRMTQDGERAMQVSSGTSVRVRPLGIPVELRFGPELEDLAEQVRALWRHLADRAAPRAGAGKDEAPQPAITLAFRADSATGARPDDAPAAVVQESAPGRAYVVSGEITRALIRALVGQALLLHAGSVTVPGLGTVTVVGGSGAGKSTAVTALARGGRYLTDELTVIDPASLRVRAYPKPVSRRPTGGTRKRDHDLAEDGLIARSGAPAPALVVMLDRRAAGPHAAPDEAGGAAMTAEPPRLRRLTLAESVVRLVGESSSVWALPDPLGTLARLIDGAGGGLEATYTEAEDLAELLAAAPGPEHEEWEVIDPVPGPVRPGSEHDGREERSDEGLLEALPFVQALATETETVILRQGSVVRFSGPGEWIWRTLVTDGPLTADEIEQSVVAQLGEHPESARLVGEAIAELARPAHAVLAARGGSGSPGDHSGGGSAAAGA